MIIIKYAIGGEINLLQVSRKSPGALNLFHRVMEQQRTVTLSSIMSIIKP